MPDCSLLNIDPDTRQWIDHASYRELLQKWRFGDDSETYFHGDTGMYFKETVLDKRREVGELAHIQASKAIGW